MDNSFQHLLEQGLEELKIPYDKDQIQMCQKFYLLYQEATSRLNLSTITEEKNFVIKHILDSLVAYPYIKSSNGTMDLGSGGGFPGIVLGIFCPNVSLTLVDVIEKKVQYLKEVVRILDLKNVQVYNGSKEKISGLFEWIIARAVSNIPKLLLYTKHYIQPKTHLLFYKGKLKTIQDELQQVKKPLLYDIVSVQVPFLDAERHLVHIYPKG